MAVPKVVKQELSRTLRNPWVWGASVVLVALISGAHEGSSPSGTEQGPPPPAATGGVTGNPLPGLAFPTGVTITASNQSGNYITFGNYGPQLENDGLNRWFFTEGAGGVMTGDQAVVNGVASFNLPRERCVLHLGAAAAETSLECQTD